jgi:hypothetical protein
LKKPLKGVLLEGGRGPVTEIHREAVREASATNAGEAIQELSAALYAERVLVHVIISGLVHSADEVAGEVHFSPHNESHEVLKSNYKRCSVLSNITQI